MRDSADNNVALLHADTCLFRKTKWRGRERGLFPAVIDELRSRFTKAVFVLVSNLQLAPFECLHWWIAKIRENFQNFKTSKMAEYFQPAREIKIDAWLAVRHSFVLKSGAFDLHNNKLFMQISRINNLQVLMRGLVLEINARTRECAHANKGFRIQNLYSGFECKRTQWPDRSERMWSVSGRHSPNISLSSIATAFQVSQLHSSANLFRSNCSLRKSIAVLRPIFK